MVGTTISHYKVLEKIGQGGMGEVYRAEDTNLSRDVAIKVLPEQFTKDPQRLARFEREAKLLASLNHPNIAAIYGLEEADGVRFLALELVEGETLAERVAKGPVPVEEALEICRQIAEGVEAAHEKGVIHRDLKPANVKVTPEGKVKILDFGLAKAFEEETPVRDISQSPTLTEEMTRAGVILGTAAYMSPEQAKGKPVDKRADIFAFGAVLYELLTGKRAFEGETITETLGAIIHKEPDWEALPGAATSLIRSLLRRCLEKDQDHRPRHIEHARIQIEESLADPTTKVVSKSGIPSPPQLWRQLLPWGMAILFAAVAIVAIWTSMNPTSISPTKFSLVPTPDALLARTVSNDVAISPDGRLVIYAGIGQRGRQLFARRLDGLGNTPVAGTELGRMPFFSPDGRSIAFFNGAELRRVSLVGGFPITLFEVAGNFASGSWGDDNMIVFTDGNHLYRIPASGGRAQELLTSTDDETFRTPVILPGGQDVLFGIQLQNFESKIASLSLKTGEKKIVIEGGRQAAYIPTGHLIYEQSGDLMFAPFDPESLRVTEEPVPVLQGVTQSALGLADYSVSSSGTLVYVPDQEDPGKTLVWVDRSGTERLVTERKESYGGPRISPDGKKVAMSVQRGTAPGDVWLYDFESDSLNRLTFEGPWNGSPTWSPDGLWVAFGNGPRIRKQLEDRSAPPELLCDDCGVPTSWHPDGSVMAVQRPVGNYNIGLVSSDGDGELELIISTPNHECCARFSPNGEWLAYVSNETGENHVWVRPYPELDVKFLVSGEEGGQAPVWSHDGKELFYRNMDALLAVPVQLEPSFRSEKPVVLFEGSYWDSAVTPGNQYYDVSSDGERFLMIKEESGSRAQINVVLNWFEELKRLVPTN